MNDFDSAEPLPADLAAIEDEQSLISVELEWLDAEMNLLDAIDRGRPTELDWQRVRACEREVIREMLAHVSARLTCSPSPRLAA